LDQRGIGYAERDVSIDPAAAKEMVQKSGQMGVPVIVVDNQVVIGFDRTRLDRLLNTSDDGHRPHLGLQIADATKVGPKLGLSPVFGALVGKIAPQSIGEKAGVQPGDIITEFNMRPIHNASDLEDTIAAVSEGQRAVIVLLRGQQTLKSEIVL
jgi:S1-C subfamily serine protease